MNKIKTNITFLSLLVVLFIDGMGLSLILPLFPSMFLNEEKSIIPLTYSIKLKNIIYGISLISFPLGMFFGAPILGNLSDKIGRKKIIIYSLVGTGIGYIISAIGVNFKILALFLVGRTLDGLTAGIIPVAQAAISDLSSHNKKMGNLGLVLFAITSGYFLGPIIADFFTNNKYFAKNDLSIPFYFVSILSFISILFLFIMDNDKPKDKNIKINFFIVFKILDQIKNLRNIHFYLVSFLLLQLGWTMFFQYIPLFLTAISLQSIINKVLIIIGIGMTLSFSILTRIFQKIFTPYYGTVFYGLILLASFCGLLSSNKVTLFTFNGISGMAYALSYSFLLSTMISKVDKENLGILMGLAASMSALSAVLSAAIGILIVNISSYFILIFSIICFFLSIIFTFYGHNK